MNIDKYPGITSYISKERFAPYLDEVAGTSKNPKEEAWRLYLWNSEVSSAFWGPIGILEVALRNSIDTIMIDNFGEFWWNKAPMLLVEDLAFARRAAESYKRKHKGQAPQHGDVISELSFGFWTALLGEGKPRHPQKDYQTKLWIPHLIDAFPYLERPERSRRRVRGVLNDVRKIRNRIAHREPIAIKYSLTKQYSQVLEVCGWIDTCLVELVEDTSTVNDAIKRRYNAVYIGDCRI